MFVASSPLVPLEAGDEALPPPPIDSTKSETPAPLKRRLEAAAVAAAAAAVVDGIVALREDELKKLVAAKIFA